MKVKATVFFLLFALPCLAQYDTIKITVRDVDILMVKVEGGNLPKGM